MYLIFGLGNPGVEYSNTRHNIGFMVIDRLARDARIEINRSRFRALTGDGSLAEQKVLLGMPQTYMNLSGQAVGEAMRFFQVPLEQVIIIHDEADLPFGTVRIKKGGGPAGHNGLKSLIEHCGADFVRVRMGIGRPPGQLKMIDFVLQAYSFAERPQLPEQIEDGARAVEAILTEGLTRAMARINTAARASGKA